MLQTARPPVTIPGTDLTAPSRHRVADYLMYGKDSYDADRELAAGLLQACPALPDLIRAERAFHERAVRRLVRAGFSQFIDLSTGYPSVVNKHHTHDLARGCRMVYATPCPLVAVHVRALVGLRGGTVVVEADPADPASLLCNDQFRKLIDLAQPVAVLATGGVLDFLPNPATLAPLRDLLAPGSRLVVSHHLDASELAPVSRVLSAAFPTWTPRTRAQVHALLEGFDLNEPGLVHAGRWPRPQLPHAARTLPILAATATKPPASAMRMRSAMVQHEDDVAWLRDHLFQHVLGNHGWTLYEHPTGVFNLAGPGNVTYPPLSVRRPHGARPWLCWITTDPDTGKDRPHPFTPASDRYLVMGRLVDALQRHHRDSLAALQEVHR
ncbi:SAM-dependent methyltransferase [Spirillospora sp. NPDC050679]